MMIKSNPSIKDFRAWRTIGVAWCIAACCYTPAVWLLDKAGDWKALPVTLATMVLFFTPWALLTPATLRASALAPLGTGRNGRSLAMLALLGIATIPFATASGLLLQQGVAWTIHASEAPAFTQLVRGTAITSFFSVPIYVAIVGIGQVLIWTERSREREKMRADARLEALRARIGPHFLFNALTAIGELAHRDPDGTQRAIAGLADILRGTLIADEHHGLGDEIAMAKDHVELHRLLIPGKLDFHVRVSPDAWRELIPTAILQPLIENALVHALNSLGQGRLAILAQVDDGLLHIRVENTMPAIIRPSRGTGSGLANVRERLAALYGGKAELRTMIAAEQFVAELSLPASVEAKSAA
ncbi:hypothetical protein QE385_003346 [Sphingomonas sp. SORGH_AS 950]|uniref:sensor histidine kinase n=1 Tax=Sphingomonas sp. SORGH_AS_0950 TaxID=3041792 RepID=UPI002788FD8E|nr:histidine kinase [Sphingomonas sp. SORGH_AS_0950]MDQ1159019.1 hypothetical protein [Sphingomonas sp. SORGH_AS_0950]